MHMLQPFDNQVEKGLIDYYTSVIVLNAGGTINMEGLKESKPSGKVKNMVEKLKKYLEEKDIYIKYESIFERAPDSSNIGAIEWEIIFKKIKDIIDKKIAIEELLKSKGVKYEKGGIVVTHGTDTMEVTSLLISLRLKLINNNLPVIFTGSYSPPNEKNSNTDALKNLKKAIILAKERFTRNENILPPGVYVVIGRDIHIPGRLTKVYSQPDSNGKYFFSFPVPVGQITGDSNIKIDRDYLNTLFQSKIEVDSLAEHSTNKLGIVEHIILDEFSSIRILDDFLNRYHFYRSESERSNIYNSYSPKKVGLIIQGNFIGNPEMPRIIDKLIEIDRNEIPIFMGSKASYNYIIKNAKEKFKYIGLIHKSMSHSKARIKLMWLLGFDIPKEDIVKFMNENIVGELYNDTNKLPEWINYESFPDQIKGVEVVIVYPNINYRVIEDAVSRLITDNNVSNENKKRMSERSKHSRLYIIGFGDGHVPTVNKSISNIVENFLTEKLGVEIKLGKNLHKKNVNSIISELLKDINKNEELKAKIIDYLQFKFRITEDNRRLLYTQIMRLEVEKKIHEIEENKRRLILNSFDKLITEKHYFKKTTRF